MLASERGSGAERNERARLHEDTVTSQPFEQQVYEREETWAEGALGEADEFRVDFLAQRIPATARTLLDVGCGNGLFLNRILERSPERFVRLCGVDRSNAALKHVRTEKYQRSAEGLGFADGEFDIVSALEMIEHLPLDVYEKTLRELCRVSRQWVMICVPFGERLEDAMVSCPSCRCRFNPYYHMRTFDESTMPELLTPASFVCREVWPVYPVKMLPLSLGRVSRVARNVLGKGASFPWFGICPMCGFSSRETDRPVPVQRRARVQSARASVVRRLVDRARFATGHRWIAALYERANVPVGNAR